MRNDQRELAAEAEALAGEAAWHRGAGDEVRRRLARAIELVELPPPSRSKAWILSQASRYAMLAGRHAEAIAQANKAIEMAAELDLPEIRTHALNNRGSARQHAGDERGFDDLYASAALAKEINSPETMRAYNNLGSLLYARGDIRKCLEMEYRAIAAAERFGLATLSRFSQANVLGSTYRLGDWDVAFAGAEVVIAQGLEGFPNRQREVCAPGSA